MTFSMQVMINSVTVIMHYMSSHVTVHDHLLYLNLPKLLQLSIKHSSLFGACGNVHPTPLHRVHMLSHAHRRMFSIGGLSLLFYWLRCRIIGSGDESGHAGLQGCSPVTAAQRIPVWCFPGRRHNGGCVPADTQHKR